MKYSEYMREIELMKAQNYTEYDMYSVIAQLLREGNNMKELSLRDVSKRRKSKRGMVFYGLSNFPDFVILDEEFKNSENWEKDIDKVYGCIEIKGIDKKMVSVESINVEKNGGIITQELGQLLGDILWYKKMLYTNGFLWKFIEWKPKEDSFQNVKNILQNQINAEENRGWYQSNEIELKNILKEVKEEILINIQEDTDDKKWKEFLNKLYKIDWRNKNIME